MYFPSDYANLKSIVCICKKIESPNRNWKIYDDARKEIDGAQKGKRKELTKEIR